jgi:GGDEF domain-containing protein
MNKRFSWIFLLASGAFFVFIVGLTGYRIEDARRHNAAAGHEHAASLAAKVRSLRDITGSVQSPLFKTDMRDVFDSEPRLLLLSLHSQQDGIVYLVSRNRSALKEPAQITPEWRGTPVYQVNRGSELLVSSGLGPDMQGLTMDALFVVMGREDLYPVVRDDLYFFLAFLLVCGVAILIVMSIQQDAEPMPPRRSSTAYAGSGGGTGAAGATTAGGGFSGGGFRGAAAHAATTAAAAAAPPRSTAAAAPQEASRAFASPRTGLVWAEYLEPRLKAELERAASSDQDLSVALLRIDEPFADGRLPLAYVEIAHLLVQSFPLHDLIFETGDDSYTLLMPDADVDTSLRLLDDFRKKLGGREIEGRTRTLSIGVSSRGGRLIDEHVLREEADAALAKASREGGNQVIGFRADAVRFRETLTGST